MTKVTITLSLADDGDWQRHVVRMQTPGQKQRGYIGLEPHCDTRVTQIDVKVDEDEDDSSES